MTMFGVKIPPIKQLLISIDFFVEQSAWGRSAAAAPKQKRTITMAPSIVLFVAARKCSQDLGGANANAQGVPPCGDIAVECLLGE